MTKPKKTEEGKVGIEDLRKKKEKKKAWGKDFKCCKEV